MISIRSVAVVVLAGLASVASIDSAFAEEAKVTKTATKLDARGELLVKLAGTELPAGLDARLTRV